MRALIILASASLSLASLAEEPGTALVPPPPLEAQQALLRAPDAAKHITLHVVDETCFTPENLPSMSGVGLDQSGTKDASKSEVTLDAPTAESFAQFQTAIEAVVKAKKKRATVYGLNVWNGRLRGLKALCVDDKPLLRARDMKPDVGEKYALTFDARALGKLKSMKKGQFRVAAVYDGVLVLDIGDIRELKTMKAPVTYNLMDLAPPVPETPPAPAP